MAITKEVRYAVVGLGHIAKGAILPAFKNAAGSKLAAIASGDVAKLKELGDRFDVEHRVRYEELDTVLNKVDAVYIALPNTLHREYAVRAMNAGVHVLCEKPLATTLDDCRAMIDAARANSVKLMTAYRLSFEPANQNALALIHAGKIGEPRIFESAFSFQVNEPNLRLRGATGGGTMFDIGVYCINAARHVFGSEPLDVSARAFNNGEERFREIDGTTVTTLRFPGAKTASFTTSFGASSAGYWRVIGTTGMIHVEPAFAYRGERTLIATIDGRNETTTFPATDQFAPQLLHFSECIRENREPVPNGEEGRADVSVVQAAFASIREDGRPVRLDTVL
jgi:glucose-fructose oxidoreductase